jgi:paraquat-inducible protein B
MNDQPASRDETTAAVRRRRRFPLVWLVPVVSAGIGAWLAWDTISKRGPAITVSFQTAEGLQVGQSHLKFKDVDMGSVSAITIPPDHSKVIVTLETKHEAESMFGEKTIFWVVRPGLFAGRVSGLDTLLSGSYIEMLPPVDPGKPQRNFVGLEDPPVLETATPGHTFTLTAKRIGSISVGSPIFFRDLDVGTVLGWDLGDLDDSVTIHAFVRAPFDQYVHDDSHFWNASGVSVQLGGSGVKVEVASLKAILLGGIAFDSAPGSRATPVSAAEHTFPLYANRDEADNVGFGHLLSIKSNFPGSVSGVAPGGDVTMHGLKIGEITEVGLVYDPVNERIVAPVLYRIEPGRIAGVMAAVNLPPGTVAARLVKQGLRATLQATNLLTGAKSVALDFYPDAPPDELRREGEMFVMPTADAGGFDTLERSASELMSKINQIDFTKIGQSVTGLTVGLDTMVNGPQLKQMLISLDGTLTQAQDVMHKVDAGMTPALHRLPEITAQLQEMMTKTSRLVASMNDGYGGDSKINRDLERLLPQLTDAVRSLRALTDLLDRHPEALIRGRTDQVSP